MEFTEPKADVNQTPYREPTFKEFSAHGHMLMVSADWDAIYWLADRHAVIRAGAVELAGPGQRLLEAPADDRGMITFQYVREYDVAKVTEGTLTARAVGILTDAIRIEETLYPPYVPAVTARPVRPYLQHPEGLTFGDAVVLDRKRREICWLLSDYDQVEDSEVFAAPVCGHGPVYWGSAFVSTHHPAWVLSALIDHMRP